jgi:mannose-6-phosphate isomerase-like protein (cupin superfamily)
MRVVNLTQKFSEFSEHWSPKVAGELNGQQVRLAKLKGEFMWHHHEKEDELFFVVKGTLRMKVREGGSERELVVREGEFLIMPHGTEHLPVADEEVHVMLLEPADTLNTGNLRNERTKEKLESV